MGGYISYLEEASIDTKMYGWIPDHPNYNDNTYDAPIKNLLINRKIDLRLNCPGICNRKNIGSSVAHAICYVYEYNIIKHDMNNIFIPSKLFLYFNQRLLKHTQEFDCGSSIRDGLSILDKIGICSEVVYPYDISLIYDKPSDEIYEEASHNKGIEYYKIKPIITNIKTLLQDSIPIIFGFGIYSSFENQVSDNGFTIKIPQENEKFIGGSCGVCVGFNDEKQAFIIMNSKGVEWGDKGYFYMPYLYLTNNNLCSNFWIIKNNKTIISESL
tara:strand:- start:2051 stop:2863 length:813 start_codon:yes stop_codon:yes gene_type:complete